MYNLFFLLNHPLLPLFAPQFLWKVAKYAQVMNWGINLSSTFVGGSGCNHAQRLQAMYADIFFGRQSPPCCREWWKEGIKISSSSVTG